MHGRSVVILNGRCQIIPMSPTASYGSRPVYSILPSRPLDSVHWVCLYEDVIYASRAALRSILSSTDNTLTDTHPSTTAELTVRAEQSATCGRYNPEFMPFLLVLKGYDCGLSQS